MTMKKILLITILFLSVFSLAQAQRGTGQRPSKGGAGGPGRMDPAERVELQTRRLNEALTLNADQIARVKAIYTKNAEEQRKEFEKTRAAGGQVDREKMREQMRTSMTKQDNEIKALLNPEQKVKFEKFLKDREERMKNWRGRPNGGGGPGQNQQ